MNVYTAFEWAASVLGPQTPSDGAIDVVAVRLDDGTINCSPFHVKLSNGYRRGGSKVVELKVNGKKVKLLMKLGKAGEVFFVEKIHESPKQAKAKRKESALRATEKDELISPHPVLITPSTSMTSLEKNDSYVMEDSKQENDLDISGILSRNDFDDANRAFPSLPSISRGRSFSAGDLGIMITNSNSNSNSSINNLSCIGSIENMQTVFAESSFASNFIGNNSGTFDRKSQNVALIQGMNSTIPWRVNLLESQRLEGKKLRSLSLDDLGEIEKRLNLNNNNSAVSTSASNNISVPFSSSYRKTELLDQSQPLPTDNPELSTSPSWSWTWGHLPVKFKAKSYADLESLSVLRKTNGSENLLPSTLLRADSKSYRNNNKLPSLPEYRAESDELWDVNDEVSSSNHPPISAAIAIDTIASNQEKLSHPDAAAIIIDSDTFPIYMLSCCGHLLFGIQDSISSPPPYDPQELRQLLLKHKIPNTTFQVLTSSNISMVTDSSISSELLSFDVKDARIVLVWCDYLLTWELAGTILTTRMMTNSFQNTVVREAHHLNALHTDIITLEEIDTAIRMLGTNTTLDRSWIGKNISTWNSEYVESIRSKIKLLDVNITTINSTPPTVTSSGETVNSIDQNDNNDTIGGTSQVNIAENNVQNSNLEIALHSLPPNEMAVNTNYEDKLTSPVLSSTVASNDGISQSLEIDFHKDTLPIRAQVPLPPPPDDDVDADPEQEQDQEAEWSLQDIALDEISPHPARGDIYDNDSDTDSYYSLNLDSQDEDTKSIGGLTGSTDGQQQSQGKTYKYRKSLVPSQLHLQSFELKDGINDLTFELAGFGAVSARMFVWDEHTKVIVADVEAVVMSVGGWGSFIAGRRYVLREGVSQLFSSAYKNGYQILFLSSSGTFNHDQLKKLTANNPQLILPPAPVFTSPDALMRASSSSSTTNSNNNNQGPDLFKVSALRGFRSLFPQSHNPFYAGFCARSMDMVVYSRSGVPKGRSFLVANNGELRGVNLTFKRTFLQMYSELDSIFPIIREIRSTNVNNNARKDSAQTPTTSSAVSTLPLSPGYQEDSFGDLNFWRIPPAIVNNNLK